jgi:hypothetical protein
MTSLKISPPVLWLFGLGLISGLASSMAPDAAEHIKLFDVPIYPGPLFGAVIAFGIYRWGKVSWWAAVLALVITVAAWVAAMRGFHAATDNGARYIYLGGIIAGAIGAAGTMLGGAVTVPSLRRLPDWLLTIGVGALAGLLVGPEVQMSGDKSFLLLFVFWQASVAACIGHALTRK